jgi:hypothetical protein
MVEVNPEGELEATICSPMANFDPFSLLALLPLINIRFDLVC